MGSNSISFLFTHIGDFLWAVLVMAALLVAVCVYPLILYTTHVEREKITLLATELAERSTPEEFAAIAGQINRRIGLGVCSVCGKPPQSADDIPRAYCEEHLEEFLRRKEHDDD